ncbi:Uncharacterized protein HDU86_001387 [Geranomyces michiganensis]|nr:Uncharacterized protein HDU86_001387 [Geranomyces michiganensis]
MVGQAKRGLEEAPSAQPAPPTFPEIAAFDERYTNQVQVLLSFSADNKAIYKVYNTFKGVPTATAYPPGSVVQHRKDGNLCGNGQFPFRPRLEIKRPALRRVLHMLRGIETAAKTYQDGFFDVADDAYTGNDLRQALLDTFSEEELADLSEIALDAGREPSAITTGRVRKFFGKSPIGLGQVILAARGIVFHETLQRGTFPSELHRIAEKRQFDPDHPEIDRMLVGLSIRIQREIFGLAERFLDILSGAESVLFVGHPSVGKTALLRDVCNFVAAKVWPELLCLADSSQELGGGVSVPHKCLGLTRVFGGLDLLLHKQKNVLLGGVSSVTLTDETASPMFQIVVEMTSRTEYRVFRDVQDAVDMFLNGKPVRIERRMVNEEGVMLAQFQQIRVDVRA